MKLNSLVLTIVCLLLAPAVLEAQVLERVFPMGAEAGKTTDIELSGSGLKNVKSLHTHAPGVTFKKISDTKYQAIVPAGTPGGLYDLRFLSASGISSPRAFQISKRREILEQRKITVDRKSAQQIELNTIVNGTIEAGGDQDFYRFAAKRGQRVVIECWSHRIDSNLRAIVEVLDSRGRQVAVNRGYYGTDPLVDLRVPKDDTYTIKVYDLIFSGGANHVYRLEVDAGPRVAFALPNVVVAGKETKIKLYGWNLKPQTQVVSTGAKQSLATSGFDEVTVTIPAKMAKPSSILPVRLPPSGSVFSGFAYHHPGTHTPTLIGVSDVPITINLRDNHSPAKAQSLAIPSEVSGQLTTGSERDWYAVQVKRGEVLYFEALGQRVGSPVDLDLSILDEQAKKILVQFNDEPRNFGGTQMPSNHFDPMGRWVAPRDGKFFVVVRNLTGGSNEDARRVYRLRVRREVPEVAVTIAPATGSPSGINLQRGGRTRLEVLAVRRNGLSGAIQVRASNLPDGVEATPIFLGPGVNRASLILSANERAPLGLGPVRFEALANGVSPTPAVAGVVVRGGRPNGWSRLTSSPPLAVGGESAIRITANGHETRKHQLYGELKVRHAPGSVLDVAINVERKYSGHNSEVKLIGVGVPTQIKNQTASIPAGKAKGYVSFYIPPTMPVGKYSFCIQAQTKVVLANKKTQSVTLISNPVVFEVHPPAFVVEIDPYAPKQIKRGQVLQVKYTVKRLNGFINKIHSELAAPGYVTKVRGLRGRGVTFVGQSESGNIQIIANKDAPLGQQPFLRIYAVGVLEDEALYHGSHFLQMKIVP